MNIMLQNGFVSRIRTENGSNFAGKEFQEMAKQHGIVMEFSAPYHPESNGDSENGLKSIKLLMNFF